MPEAVLHIVYQLTLVYRLTPRTEPIKRHCPWQYLVYMSTASLTDSCVTVRHRAATTGSTGFINLLLKPPQGSPKTRLNTADRVGTLPSSLRNVAFFDDG